MDIKKYFSEDWAWVLWILILLSLVIHLILSLNNTPGFWTDSFIYLLQADYFTFWNKGHPPVLEQAIVYRNFPPLYPFFLSVIGAGSNNIVIASIATSFLLFPICIFYVDWQTKEGLSKHNALITALLFVLLPATLLFSTELWSENLYILLVLLTLWSFRKAKDDADKWLYFSALCCGLAFITRSVGISLVVALLIAVYFFDKRKIILTIAIIFTPWLIWAALSNEFDYSNTYFKNALLERYKIYLGLHENIFNGLLEIAKTQTETLWKGLQLQFNNSLNNGTAVLAFLITIATLYSFLQRLICLSLDALYVLFYLGIIFVWNYSDHNVRFIYVVVPFVLFYSQLTIVFILKRLNNDLGRLKNFLLPLLISVVIFPCILLMAERFITIPGENIKNYSNDRFWLAGEDRKKMYKQLVFKKELIESVKEIKEVVSEDECIYSVTQEIVMLYAQRRAIVPPLQNLYQKNFIEQLNQCRYMLVVGTVYSQHEPLYPVDRVKDISWVLRQKFFPQEFSGEIVSVLLEIDKNIDM